MTMLGVDHVCAIPGRRQDVRFLPGRGKFERMLDCFHRAIMASHRNPSAHKYLRSHACIVAEMRRHLRNFKFTIHPFSIFRYFWEIAMIPTVIILLLLTPYHAAFGIKTGVAFWVSFQNFLLLLCCADVVINFRTGYFDEELRVVVMDQRKIISRYVMRGTFLPDFIGSLPTDLFFIIVWRDYEVIREMTSLTCCFRIFSLSTYIRRIAYSWDTPLVFYEFFVIIFWLLVVLHWQACLYWFVPIATTSMFATDRPRNDSWLHAAQLWETDRSEQYVSCLLRAIATFLRSGFLRTNPKNEADLYMIILLQSLGTITAWVLLARVMQFFKGTNSSRLRYQGTVAQLKKYMRHKQLPHPTQRRIMAYYEFRFQHRYFREIEIMNTLSAQMRQEIGMHSCRKLVENVTFFKNLPHALLSRIVSLLKSEIFLTNDVIMRVNQPGECMYFIATGTVAIYTSSGKEVCHLEDGAHFGEVALVMADDRRVANVVAVEVCELYRLNRADFARTIHPYPMLWDRIKKIAIERHEKTMILNAQ